MVLLSKRSQACPLLMILCMLDPVRCKFLGRNEIVRLNTFIHVQISACMHVCLHIYCLNLKGWIPGFDLLKLTTLSYRVSCFHHATVMDFMAKMLKAVLCLIFVFHIAGAGMCALDLSMHVILNLCWNESNHESRRRTHAQHKNQTESVYFIQE